MPHPSKTKTLHVPTFPPSHFLTLALTLLASNMLQAATPVAWWRFDEPPQDSTQDIFHGRYTLVDGIVGKALKPDGFTGFILRAADKAPRLTDDFTIEAWIALATYPWNFCPIVDHQQQPQTGYFFGIDAEGHLGLQLSIDGKWEQAVSEKSLPLREWTHVTGTFNPQTGISVYIDGELAANNKTTGAFQPASNLDLLIGKHRDAHRPTGTIRPKATFPIHTFFDGLIDELKIYNIALDPPKIPKTKPQTPLKPRRMPTAPPGAFGAFHTKLEYYPEWDALWRISDHPDVVVRFDDADYQFIFWRGTNYIPCWVTAEGIWYTNEFNETWGHGAVGCAEPMSDKQCRHSNVRILENSDARAVIHWRYALIDVRYAFTRVDPETGWGDWSDEIYTIYPDGVGVRKITLWSTQPTAPHEYQDSITLHNPGRRPEDEIELDALTMVNMKGETKTYRWTDELPKVIEQPEKANIQLINLKSETNPFLIVSDEPCRVRKKGPRFRPYHGGRRTDISPFPWWNHWPVAMIPSDGRFAFAADRPAHSCITNQTEWADYELTENSCTRIMLHGLTTEPAAKLVGLARSWLKPPKLELHSEGFTNNGYDPTQRAYIISANNANTLRCRINASTESPIRNLSIVVRNWGNSDAALTLNGEAVPQGKQFRMGHRKRIDGTDLVTWINMKSDKPIEITLRPTTE